MSAFFPKTIKNTFLPNYFVISSYLYRHSERSRGGDFLLNENNKKASLTETDKDAFFIGLLYKLVIFANVVAEWQ